MIGPRIGALLIAILVISVSWVLSLMPREVLWLPHEPPIYAQENLFRAPVTCNQSVAISGNTIATAELVALTSGQQIRVCGFLLTGGGATTVKFVRGTGTNCGTGTADLTAPFEFGDNTSVTFGSGVGTVLRVPVGEALCWVNSAALQVSGLLVYAKGV